MQSVLQKVDNDALEVFVVWIPEIRTDSYEASLQSRSLIPDPRAKHYWDGGQALGDAMAPVMGMRARMAWDVYLTYDADAEWGDVPPEPSNWLHQKSSEEPALYLDAEKLEAILRSALE